MAGDVISPPSHARPNQKSDHVGFSIVKGCRSRVATRTFSLSVDPATAEVDVAGAGEEMSRGRVGIGALAALLVASAGCDWFDFDVDLAKQSFALDFGQQTGTMPTVACDASGGACSAAGGSVNFDASSTAGVPSTVDVSVACDTGSGLCYATANARASQTVGVLQDDSFSSKVGRNTLSLVKLADIAYTIPSNTLTFDIPHVDVYAGPAGSTRETDPGVALVGTTQPIMAGVTSADAQHLMIDDDSPARPVIEHAVENKQDFVFIVVASPRMNAGSTVPAGAIQIDIAPKLTIGL